MVNIPRIYPVVNKIIRRFEGFSKASPRFAACPVGSSRDTCVRAGVDKNWEQEKLEASLSWPTGQGKMPENAVRR